jgi:hypothetical protein
MSHEITGVPRIEMFGVAATSKPFELHLLHATPSVPARAGHVDRDACSE